MVVGMKGDSDNGYSPLGGEKELPETVRQHGTQTSFHAPKVEVLGGWRDFEDGCYPRRGELILIRNESSTYERVLIADGSLDWWWYDSTAKGHGLGSGTKLSFHGITQWLLVGEVSV